MRVVICGSRTITNKAETLKAIQNAPFDVTAAICGGAKGPDMHGEQWAKDNGVPFKRYNANWAKHGKSAGMLRNKEMVENADAVIAVWDGESPGTRNTIELAKAKGLPLYVHNVVVPKVDPVLAMPPVPPGMMDKKGE